MSRVLAGLFRGNAGAVAASTAARLGQLTLLEALDELTPEQRDAMTSLIREFAGAVRKPKKGAHHRTRDFLSFLMSPAVLDWFTAKQLHELAGHIAIAGHIRDHEDRKDAPGE